MCCRQLVRVSTEVNACGDAHDRKVLSTIVRHRMPVIHEALVHRCACDMLATYTEICIMQQPPHADSCMQPLECKGDAMGCLSNNHLTCC